MRSLVTITAACLASTALVAATPWAQADDSVDLTTTTHGADRATGVSRAHTVTGARAAAVTLGQVPAVPGTACTPGPNVLAQYLEAGPPSYTAPTAGVITSYSVRAGGTAGLARLVVLGPSAIAGHRTVVGLSAQNLVAINTVNTFPTRVSIAAGQSIGLNNSANSMVCWGTGVAGDQVAAALLDPGVSTDFSPVGTFNNSRVNISAVLEPDVDGDLFGDISQDLCPQSALTQAACPAPDTTVTKRPQKKSTKRSAKFKFTSTIAGSTFTCAVDGKSAKPCTSPFKKRFKVGKHKVVITATSGFGVVDPTPVKVKFKVIQ